VSRFKPERLVRLSSRFASIAGFGGEWTTTIEFEALHSFVADDYVAWLSKTKAGSGKTFQLEIGNELCRFFCLPPLADLRSLAEVKKWINLRFESLYENDPSDWVIRAHLSPRHPCLAVAIPRKLLGALTDAHTRAGIRATRIEPRFCKGYDANLRTFKQKDAVVDVSDNTLVCGWQRQGDIVDIQVRRYDGLDDQRVLHTAIEGLRKLRRAPAPLRVAVMGTSLNTIWSSDGIEYQMVPT
jgi:hypothetical protein